VKKRDLLPGLLFRLRNLPGLFKRFKGWFLLLLFILILGVLAPWVGLIGNLVSGFFDLLKPVLENKVGRFVLFNLVLIVVLLVVYRRFKDRGRKLVGAWALDRFLQGMLHLSAGRYRLAARAFEKVVRMGRWVDLSLAVDSYAEIRPDARIKLALCYREMGEVEKAMKSLELLKVRDLPPSMKRDHAEAKAFVYSLSPELMDETIDREVETALEKDGANRRLLRLRRDRAERTGRLPVAIESQRRIVKASPAKEKPEERKRLAALHARLAARLHRAGRPEEALAEISRSRSSDPGLMLPNLLAGDIERERGNVKGAVAEWAKTPSLPALERVRGLLDSGELEAEGDLGRLVESFPRSGMLLVLAEHYLERGKLRKAKNCVRKFEELGLENRHSARLLARILRAEGDEQGARRLEWLALKGFLGADR